DVCSSDLFPSHPRRWFGLSNCSPVLKQPVCHSTRGVRGCSDAALITGQLARGWTENRPPWRGSIAGTLTNLELLVLGSSWTRSGQKFVIWLQALMLCD